MKDQNVLYMLPTKFSGLFFWWWEQILWPDGIFLTKHPNRKPSAPISSLASQKDKNMLQKDNKVENQLTAEQQLEAARRAKFVYELMIGEPLFQSLPWFCNSIINEVLIPLSC